MSDADPPDDLIPPRKAAKILGLALATVYRWALAGKLRSWKVRQLVRVSEAEVRGLLTPRPAPAAERQPAAEFSPAARARRDAHTRRELARLGYPVNW